MDMEQNIQNEIGPIENRKDENISITFELNKKNLAYAALLLIVFLLFITGIYISQTGSFFPYQPDESLSYKSQVSALVNDPGLSRAELADEVAKVYKNEMEIVSEAKGQFGALGDAFGGLLNPVLSFISILVILYTVWQNRIALDHSSRAIEQAQQEARTTAELNEEMLKLAHEQYEESAEQTRLARDEQAQALEVQRKQKFESTFASLCEQNVSFSERFTTGPEPSVVKINQAYENMFHYGPIDNMFSTYTELIPEIYRYYAFIKSVVKYCILNDAEDIHYDLLSGVIPDDVIWASMIIATSDPYYADEQYIKMMGECGFIDGLVVYPSTFYSEHKDKVADLEIKVERSKMSSRSLRLSEMELSSILSGVDCYKKNLGKVFSKIDKRYYASNPHLKKLEEISRS